MIFTILHYFKKQQVFQLNILLSSTGSFISIEIHRLPTNIIPFFKQSIVEDMSIILVLDTDLFYSYHPYFLGVYLYFTEKLVSVDIKNQQKL